MGFISEYEERMKEAYISGYKQGLNDMRKYGDDRKRMSLIDRGAALNALDSINWTSHDDVFDGETVVTYHSVFEILKELPTVEVEQKEE